MTRVIAGIVGGRRLVVPAGSDTRPTTDRVREALFSSLGDLTGLRVLDLWSGSGALGLEALSRGAIEAVFVERAAPALRALRANVSALGLAGASVQAADVHAFLAGGHGGAPAGYDLVLADPPYAEPTEQVSAILARLVDGGWLGLGGTVVVERDSMATPPVWPSHVTAAPPRRYGGTTLYRAHLLACPSVNDE